MKDAFVQKTPKKFKSSGLQCRNWVLSPKRLQRNSKSLKDKGVQVQKPPLYIELIQHCDKTVRNYTGIDSYKLFKILHKYLTACCDDKKCTIKLYANCDFKKQFTFLTTKEKLNGT